MPIQKRPDTDSVWPDLLDYFRKDFWREIRGWRKVFIYYGMLTPLAIIAIIAIFIYVDPIPPHKAYLASGQAGSSYRVLSEKFAEYFAKYGFELVLVETPGLDEGFLKLNDDKSPVNASFLTAGTAKADAYPELRSLGSIQFSPIWLFYKGKELGSSPSLEELSKMNIAVGLKGSHTQSILRQLWALHGMTYRDEDEHLIELPHQQAAEDFSNGMSEANYKRATDNFEKKLEKMSTVEYQTELFGRLQKNKKQELIVGAMTKKEICKIYFNTIFVIIRSLQLTL